MATILVVDDSAVDRRVVGGLLEKQDGLSLQYACDGAEAMQVIEQSPVDVVVSDLIMPEMDGLELVKTVKERFPLIPVILMTSKGNEEIAVQALQAGAASYTPKSSLVSSLADTVQSVMSVSDQARDEARLIECLTASECTFVLENDSTLIPPLINYLQDDATRLGLCDDGERIRIGVALDEALVNALYHGNLEVSSELRDSDYDAYRDLVQRRRQEEPYRHRNIQVAARISTKEARFVIKDQGPGFDPTGLPDPTDMANLEKLGGRGVLLMRTFMDEVVYNETGNEVTLVKRPSGDGQAETDSESSND